MTRRITARHRRARLVTIEAAGAGCILLARDYAAAMAGETLSIDGGHHILGQAGPARRSIPAQAGLARATAVQG
ncbi:MAG TPA: hypothetical protein VE684_10660 [Crenalkalicoccus sp.]|nr:hypothetical protein [Crenalkalicoccus sp.]